MKLNITEIKKDFPILDREVYPKKKLVYLDSAASSQKPIQVIDAMGDMYKSQYANIHRGIYKVAEEATESYELAREKVAAFIGAESPREIIFTRNATESINLVAHTWARKNLAQDDVVLLTEMEHHSNLVPWQMLVEEKGIRLEFVPINNDGLLDQNAYVKLLALRPKLVAFTQMSNVLGTVNPANEMVYLAHEAGAVTLLDGAQSVPHIPVSVQELKVDFLAFSGHKMLGPSGIGVLYGRMELLEEMPPFLGGGDMIKSVHLRSFSTNEVPYKFEAGTPAIVEAVGLGAAIDYLNNVGMRNIAAHEKEIISYALDRLEEIPYVKVYGPEAQYKGGVASFTIEGVHPHDISQILDSEGVAIRAGHHCAMPLHEKLNLGATARASFYLYNSKEDVDVLVNSIYKVIKMFGI